ncbi:MAG: hypothetical protein V4608_11020 [Bacteroidota bacterium]
MEWIANQPVFFGEESACECGEGSFPQLSDNTDTIQFQFNIDNCGAPQMLQDFNEYPYNDWVLSDGWAITDGNLCHIGADTTSSYVPMINADFPAGYYQITIVVESFNGVGSIDVSLGNVIDGYDELGEITGVGTWNFYGFVTPATNGAFQNLLNFQPSSENVEICFSEISGYRILTDAKVAVYNSAGTYITEITYANDEGGNFTFYQDTVTMSIDWSELNVPVSDGCYYLCFLDPCLNSGGQNYSADITNPMFAGNADGWSLGGSTYFDEAIEMTAGDILEQGDVFNAYINQCVYVDVTAITGQVFVYFGDTLVKTITTTGIHKCCGIPTTNLDIVIECDINSTATIENVRPITVAANGITIPFPTADYVCNIQSNTFKIADYTNACTILVNACNNENGLGFAFGSSNFSPRLRIAAKLKGMKYPSERIANEDSAGTKKVVYYSGRKAKNFSADLEPEYIHDFLRLLAGFDNIYFDNVRYFVEDDEYNVIENDSFDNVGGVKFLVSTRTQDVKNTNCNGTENDCSLA